MVSLFTDYGKPFQMSSCSLESASTIRLDTTTDTPPKPPTLQPSVCVIFLGAATAVMSFDVPQPRTDLPRLDSPCRTPKCFAQYLHAKPTRQGSCLVGCVAAPQTFWTERSIRSDVSATYAAMLAAFTPEVTSLARDIADIPIHAVLIPGSVYRSNVVRLRVNSFIYGHIRIRVYP